MKGRIINPQKEKGKKLERVCVIAFLCKKD